jgi:hypothetical protein
LPAHLVSQDRRVEHRTWIGGAIKTLITIVSGDWPTDPRLEAEMGFMWANDLEWFPQDIIETAIATYRRSETRKPSPAAIIKLCREHMPKPRLISAPEPERERVTAEQAQAILDEFGFGGIVKRMPRSGDE